jgi:hypothetical protein
MRDVNTTDIIYFHMCKMSQNWRYKSEKPPHMAISISMFYANVLDAYL